MCYPPPGPRCSNHAYREFLEATRKFLDCDDPSLKIMLGDRMEQKKAVYDSTPRGQKELAAEIATKPEGLEKEALKLRLRVGIKKREEQLNAYSVTVENKGNNFNEYMRLKKTEYKKGRYQDACGLASIFLAKKYPERTFNITDVKTIVSEGDTILVLPEKYVHPWGEAKHNNGYFAEDKTLEKILNKSFNPFNPTVEQKQLMMDWFVKELEKKRYTSVAVVNRRTEDVAVVDVKEITNLFDIKFRLKTKTGGSTAYRGEETEIAELLEGSVFEGATIEKVKGIRKTVLVGPELYPKEYFNLSKEVYVSPRYMEDGSLYYEVRRRHVSDTVTVSVILELKKLLTVTGVKDEHFATPAAEQIS